MVGADTNQGWGDAPQKEIQKEISQKRLQTMDAVSDATNQLHLIHSSLTVRTVTIFGKNTKTKNMKRNFATSAVKMKKPQRQNHPVTTATRQTRINWNSL